MEYLIDYQIITNQLIAEATYLLQLQGDNSAFSKPGQFLSIAIPSCYLRRPFSISRIEDDILTIAYKVVGEGTRILSTLASGQKLSALVAGGNGFAIDNQAAPVVLVGGGLGCAPLVQLATELKKKGSDYQVVLGFNKKAEVFFQAAFLTDKVTISTIDGSFGYQGTVIDALKNIGLLNTYYYACGPEAMLKALVNGSQAKGQVSLEARLGCGYGVCRGCSIATKSGMKRLCTEGPVFDSEDLLWSI